MPNARIITSRPELADPVADSLRQSGYAVEVTTPEHASFQPVDLEMNLDRCDSTPLVHQPGEQDVTFADIPQGYRLDPASGQIYKIEREFVLAPLWRKLMAKFGKHPQESREDAPVSMSFLGLQPEQTPEPIAQHAPEYAPERVPERAPEPVTERILRPELVQPAPAAEPLPAPEPVYEAAAEPIPEPVPEPVMNAEPIIAPVPLPVTPMAPLEEPMPVHYASAQPEPQAQQLQKQPEPQSQPEPVQPEIAAVPISTQGDFSSHVLRARVPVDHERVEALPRDIPEPVPPPPTFEDTRSDLHSEWHEQFEAAPEPTPVVPLHAPYSEFDTQKFSAPAPPAPKVQTEAPAPAPRERKTPVLIAAAMKAEELRARAARRFAEWRTRPSADSKQPLRDYAWRQALPAAIGLALAFLVGWSAALHSSGNSEPATTTKGISAAAPATAGFTVGPNAPATTGGYTVGPQRPPATVANAAPVTNPANASAPVRKPSPSAPAAKRKSSARHRVYRDDTADDVVIHHYSTTTKPKVPEIHRASLKKYSDLD